MKQFVLALLGFCVLAIQAQAQIRVEGIESPIYPVNVHEDGQYEIQRALPKPPGSLWDSIFALPAYAAGFDVAVAMPTAYGPDGSICLSTGTFAGLTVPRCTNGNGKFYFAFGLPALPASPPSYTIAFDINNSGGETTEGNHWCYRASCASVTAGGPANTLAALTFGTVTGLSDNQFTSPCNATNKMCLGAATASFTCFDNGTAAGCSGTACNDHLQVIFVEPRTTSCTATVSTVSLDYGLAHLVEAN